MNTKVSKKKIAGKPRKFIYVGISFLCFLIPLIGFWPSYYSLDIIETLQYPIFIHFHQAIYLGWLSLFFAQAWFAANGKLELHMKVGKYLIYYGILLIFTGLVALFGMFYVRVQLGTLRTPPLEIGPILDMITFSLFFASAIYFRKVPELHKRLMVVATTSLLIAAVVRMWFLNTPGVFRVDNAVRNFLIVYPLWTSPILIAMMYDFFRHRIIHPVYVIGLIFLALESPVVRQTIHRNENWIAFGNWLAKVVSS
ncbi:MAG: hypothetical protein CBC38_07605 [Gammaproteobacteria bacterium TMED78]|nr:MAG: hypothetical protein CBC38_07605 [Gammaproteobacteria bacterium TMED78]